MSQQIRSSVCSLDKSRFKSLKSLVSHKPVLIVTTTPCSRPSAIQTSISSVAIFGKWHFWDSDFQSSEQMGSQNGGLFCFYDLRDAFKVSFTPSLRFFHLLRVLTFPILRYPPKTLRFFHLFRVLTFPILRYPPKTQERCRTLIPKLSSSATRELQW